MRTTTLALLTCVALLIGCGDDNDSVTGAHRSVSAPPGEAAQATGADSASTRFPDIVKAELTPQGDGAYTVAVTVSSPYDTPQRYADGWRVSKAGTDEVLGKHALAHDHAAEQPFTRMQSDLRIPAGVERVTIEGRDQDNGYGGDTVTVDVPR